MNWYKISFQMGSPMASQWQADTIFGHVCWALAHMEGAEFLDNFLGLYDLGDPPLVISNGFPGDLLPRPIMPTSVRKAATSLEQEQQDFRQAKEARKALWFSPEEFERVRRGELVLPASRRPLKPRVMMHNQINRLTGTTGPEGALFPLEEIAFSDEQEHRITVYAVVDPGFVASLRRCLGYIAVTGFGKRKSVGYGAISHWELQAFDGFPELDGANGFMALSNFVPALPDPARGAWNTIVKRGKLSEDYAALGDPFKRPLLMLTAGSCFYDAPVRTYYGRLVHGVHPDFPEVVQYGLALPVSIRLPELDEVKP